jgi:FkbM family methyltransferase
MASKLIYDIGMHEGEDSICYLKKGYNVLAIEANPFLVEKATKKFDSYIRSGQLTIRNLGIAQSEGILPFYINRRLTEWSSFDKELGSRNGTEFDIKPIQCTTTKKLFEEYGMPYYMKVDIEGNDHLCISDIDENGDRPKYVSCEACDINWLDILASKGYKKFKLISQGDNFTPIDLIKERKSYYPHYLTIKNGIKLQLQKVINFQHPYGSSGPFGEDTKGEWKTYTEVKSLFEEFYSATKGLANKVDWFDFHATW